MNLETKIIRMFWTLVEKSEPYSLLHLSDHELIEQLIYEVKRVVFLTADESKILSQYIGTRTILIRELVHSRIK